jgi:rhamnopyranosyl-N-acetylglucosaminyl-diphospho-decaprenol beta-1,3/1,4-galactofuranosyltransferase
MIDSFSTCRIAAVIPTYNRKGLLEKCIESLLRQTRPLDGVVVVDNASTDGTEALVREKFSAKVTYVRLPKNTGSAGGFYEGIHTAYEQGYDWIWCMDNDAEPVSNCLEELLACPGSRDPQVGVLASLVVNSNGQVEANHHKRTAVPFEKPALVEAGGQAEELIPLQATAWAGALIRREAVKVAGLPRKEFFLFFDDTEYTHRISRSFRVLLVPRSKVIHKPDSRSEQSAFAGRMRSVRYPASQPWRYYCDLRNRVFFVTRYAKKWALPLVVVIILLRKMAGVLMFDDSKMKRIGILLRALKDGVLAKFDLPADL